MATRRIKSEDSSVTPECVAEAVGGGEDLAGMSFKGFAALANPPGNPKASYYLGPKPGPEQWRQKAGK